MKLHINDSSVEVSLKFSPTRGITVNAEWEDGDVWEIVTLTHEGTLIRHAYIESGVFELDDKERIVEVEEE